MDLSDFETVNDEEETVYKQRPETKTQADLDRVISKNKPQAVVDKFAAMVAAGDQWNWFDLAVAYADELAAVEEYNLDLPIIGQDEETGEDIIAQPKALPVEPVRPTQRTVNDILLNDTALIKRRGRIVSDYSVSLTESNINIVTTKAAAASLVGASIYPLSFELDNVDGKITVEFRNKAAFALFVGDFLL